MFLYLSVRIFVLYLKINEYIYLSVSVAPVVACVVTYLVQIGRMICIAFIVLLFIQYTSWLEGIGDIFNNNNKKKKKKKKKEQNTRRRTII